FRRGIKMMEDKSLDCKEVSNMVASLVDITDLNIKLDQYKCLRDEDLIRFFIDRTDEDAFNELVSRHGEKIYRTAFRITRNHDAAEDILQNVFIILFEKLKNFRNESKFTTWLFRVASNASYMYLRTENKVGSNELRLEDITRFDESGNLIDAYLKDTESIPDKNVINKEMSELLEEAMNELDPKYKDVFHLRDVEGLSNQEVAEIMDLSVAAVKSRILRARNFMKDKLGDYLMN
ncbi:MAG: RNA polymerase sigma factor, partial [Thermodesulfobacteriota bacterium]